jgi:hypothetical protein
MGGERGGGTSAALLGQSAYNERSIPPLVKDETPLPSSDEGTHRYEGDRIVGK